MNIFLAGFYVLCVLCALLFLYTRSALPAVNDAAFNKFQNTYLVVYLLAMGKFSRLRMSLAVGMVDVSLLLVHKICESAWKVKSRLR